LSYAAYRLYLRGRDVDALVALNADMVVHVQPYQRTYRTNGNQAEPYDALPGQLADEPYQFQ
jgi:hypothetical protein